MILDYYFQLLAGIPASHARARLTLLCAYDASPRSLTEKVLERPRLIQRIRHRVRWFSYMMEHFAHRLPRTIARILHRSHPAPIVRKERIEGKE